MGDFGNKNFGPHVSPSEEGTLRDGSEEDIYPLLGCLKWGAPRISDPFRFT